MKRVNYEIVHEESDPNTLVIRDLGPWDGHFTVTNAVEEVVKELTANGNLWNGRTLLYYDTQGDLDEIRHVNGEFVGFRHGDPRR